MDTKRFFLYAIVIAALALAGCGGNGGTTAMQDPMRDPDPMPPANLAAAKSAAMTAATAAGEAADAAEAAANAQMDNMAADEANYALAQNAAMRARTAATAAAVANNLAQAATDVAAAEAQRDIAQSQQATAEAEQANAVRYANMVMMAQQAIDNEDQRVMDVASARSAAMQSYMDADADATNAEAAATAAEETAPNSAGAMAARAAATAARAAATAAKAAHDAIMDGMSKADADAQAAEAAKQAGTADSQYMTAKRENDTIQTAAAVNQEQQRMRDIAAARDAAKMYAEEALGHYNAAVGKAADARAQATAAREAANKAMAARTDYANAGKYADMAEAAADKAEAAEATALMAKDAAQAAYMDAMNAETVAAAQMAREEAKAQNVSATAQNTGADGAGMNYMTARDAAADAATAAGTHVLRLFQAANGAHVADNEDTMDVDEKAEHVTSVGAAMAVIAATAAGNQAAGTTATITYPGDTVENPNEDDGEFSEGMLGITVNVAGTTEIVAELRESRDAMDLNDDGDTDDTGEAAYTQTARKIADLGAFQGYELWEDDGDATANTADRARAILFTNKQKGDDSVLAVVAATARSVVAQTVAANELGDVTSTAKTITGVTWTPSGEQPLTGTLTCGDACSITLGADGTVGAIRGYTFTGSRSAREARAAAEAMENNNYLAFGVWLEESDDGSTDTFGAFAVGGTDYAVNVANAVTGTAIYTGNAAGAHHRTGDGVNWFHGDASLTANFGAADASGTVSGSISNIRVNGGDAMSTPIYLGQAGLTNGSAIFNGAAFMGEPTAPGASTHEFDGTWSGSFFGATDNDPDTTDVNESITAPLAAAGTFGVTKSEGTGDDMVVESFVGAFGANKQ